MTVGADGRGPALGSAVVCGILTPGKLLPSPWKRLQFILWVQSWWGQRGVHVNSQQ